MWYDDHPLRHYFAGLTEQTFIETFGLADPPLTDYLSTLLSRFIHVDVIFKIKASAVGTQLTEVADMLMEAESIPREGRTSREMHRHIGDFALFWVGVYPESLKHLRNPMRKDYFMDYFEQGKRSYLIASTFDKEPFVDEAPVLRRISDQFELCAYGLSRVRREWEKK